MGDTLLEPCPWCGLTEHLRVRAEGSWTADMPARPYRVVCHNIAHDSVEGPVGYGIAGAHKEWNARTGPKPLLDALEEARALVAKLDEVEEASKPVFIHAHVHGFNYTGPNYGGELSALKASLDKITTAKEAVS